MEEFARGVADADHLEGRVLRESLRDQSRGIGEVDEPGAGRNMLDHFRVTESHRKSTERHRGSRRTGASPARPVRARSRRVRPARGRHSAHADAAENEIGSVRRLFELRGAADLKSGAHSADDLAADPRYGFGARLVQIEEGQFSDLEKLLSLSQSVDEQWRPHAAAANNGDLTHLCLTIRV